MRCRVVAGQGWTIPLNGHPLDCGDLVDLEGAYLMYALRQGIVVPDTPEPVTVEAPKPAQNAAKRVGKPRKP